MVLWFCWICGFCILVELHWEEFAINKASLLSYQTLCSQGCSTNSLVMKQGSSENDGRSNVYDRSEFKVIYNWCYPNCCLVNACTNNQTDKITKHMLQPVDRKQGLIRHKPCHIQLITDCQDGCRLSRKLQTVKPFSEGCRFFLNIGNIFFFLNGGVMNWCQTNFNTKFQILSSIFEDLPPFFRISRENKDFIMGEKFKPWNSIFGKITLPILVHSTPKDTE